MKVFNIGVIPVYSWASDIEKGAMDQVENLANYPFAFHHIALMPDCHQGFGMPIGGVMATKDIVIPNGVGVDIGCGMLAIATSLYFQDLDQESLKKMMSHIRNVVPLGFKHHKEPCQEKDMPDIGEFMDKNSLGDMPIVKEQFYSARHQLGTLGGGNHFIEIQKGMDEKVWIMIHSGSRNIGKRVADHYNRMAKLKKKDFGSDIPSSWQLDFLPISSDLGRLYLGEMEYCVLFAEKNRAMILEKITGIFHRFFPRVKFEKEINIAHNYASFEKHFQNRVVVHRKGATLAIKGKLGIIPGSQGSNSFIVQGLSNPLSFNSCSHGAGRLMGRKEAIRSLDLAMERQAMDKKGIIHALRGRGDLEEAPGAYKDINQVLENQKDLVDIVEKLAPLAVIKG